MPFSAPVLTYRAKGLASNIQSKVLKVHNTLININITAILAPEMTYTPKYIGNNKKRKAGSKNSLPRKEKISRRKVKKKGRE